MMMKKYKEYVKELKEREVYYSECVSNAEMLRSDSIDTFRKTLDDIQTKLLEAEKMSIFKKIRF